LVGVRGAEPAQNGAASGREASSTVAGSLVNESIRFFLLLKAFL
jgi:hypothetical protein